MSAPDRGFEFTDEVTSDLCYRASGRTLADLFAAAADGLLAITLENPEAVEPRERLTLELEEPDRELLLLRFLSELVYLRDARGLLLRAEEVEVDAGPPARLSARLAGERFDPKRHRPGSEVKAITAHALEIRETPRGYEARITPDL